MSFQIIINAIPDKELGPIISRLQLPRGVTYEAKYVHDAVLLAKKSKKSKANGAKNPHSRADSLLTMTGKTAMSGTIIEQGMDLFEKLEKRKGIGNVKVRDFREDLVKHKLLDTVAQRCITEKFLTYIE